MVEEEGRERMVEEEGRERMVEEEGRDAYREQMWDTGTCHGGDEV